MKIHVDVDADKLLRRLGRLKGADDIRAALLRACQKVQEEARTEHRFHSRTGALENAIEYKVDANNLTGQVFIDDHIAPHGRFVHEPTGKYAPPGKRKQGGNRHADGSYDIFPRGKKMLRFLTSPNTAARRRAPYGRFRDGAFTFAYGVTHPGSPADPFLHRAAERSREEINGIFERHLQRTLREAGV